jgi:hypothetical protein
MRRVMVVVLGWALVAAGMALLSPAHSVSAHPRSNPTPNPFVPTGADGAPTLCVDVLMMGFRGSGEHPRGRRPGGETTANAINPWQLDDFTTPDFAEQRRRLGVSVAQDHLGHTVGAVYEALHHRLRSQGRSVGFWSVGVDDSPGFGYGELYAAPPVDVANLARYLQSMSLDSLMREVLPVVQRLVVGDANREPWCPSTQIVVVGFSQGAVLARALVTNLHQQIRPAGPPHPTISDLILIGDPLFRREEHTRHGVVHPSDHQVDGLLRIDLVALCDRSRMMRALCAMTASGSGSVRSWFREVWQSLRDFAQHHPHLLRTSLSRLHQHGTHVHVVCDSGDVVCSPIRIIATLRWDSDFPELLRRRPHRTIHGSYHQSVPWHDVIHDLTALRSVATPWHQSQLISTKNTTDPSTRM